MHSKTILTFLSLTTLAFSLPYSFPTSDSSDGPVDVVSNSVSPLSANDAGNSNSNTGALNGNTISIRNDDNPVDVVSNSVSPLSANDAGNRNSNTGLLNGNNLKRDGPTDVVSNSLSPGSANVAGNNNKNTGTLNGNEIDISPTVAPTINA